MTQPTYVQNASQPLFIGAGATESAGDYFFVGDVDEVAIYDYALSATQVHNHYLASPCASIFNFSVLGGGTYCPGGMGKAISLNGSQSAVSYQLELNGNDIGTPVAGTGSAISFGDHTAGGDYTVVSTVASTGCATNMSGSTTVTIATWHIAYNVTGVGAYTLGGTGVFVGLDGSQVGINYQLDGIGTPVAGTGGAISFGNQIFPGNYTVAATIAGLGCPTNMSGTATVTVIPLPAFLAWQSRYFGCTNCPQAAWTADPDGDGQNNFAEFLAGTDPTSHASSFRITSILPTNGAIF